MIDIIERLMICAKFDPDQKEAAEEITRLRDENEKLREALKPFAADADDFDFMEDHDEVGVPVGDLRAAAAALKESGE